jgi:hypothetical protein
VRERKQHEDARIEEQNVVHHSLRRELGRGAGQRSGSGSELNRAWAKSELNSAWARKSMRKQRRRTIEKISRDAKNC